MGWCRDITKLYNISFWHAYSFYYHLVKIGYGIRYRFFCIIHHHILLLLIFLSTYGELYLNKVQYVFFEYNLNYIVEALNKHYSYFKYLFKVVKVKRKQYEVSAVWIKIRNMCILWKFGILITTGGDGVTVNTYFMIEMILGFFSNHGYTFADGLQSRKY